MERLDSYGKLCYESGAARFSLITTPDSAYNTRIIMSLHTVVAKRPMGVC